MAVGIVQPLSLIQLSFMTSELLLHNGYFPRELPYCFETIKFSKKAAKLLNYAKSTLSKAGYELAQYSIPTTSLKRRMLNVPHPVPQLLLSEAIASNWSFILGHFAMSHVSFSVTTITGVTDKNRWKIDYQEYRDHCLVVGSTRLWELKLDIESFYPSIYTHSIPWALHGREFIKSMLPNVDYSLLGNSIDKLIQRSQSNETKGLPVGPETSRIIGELISTRLDKELIDGLRNQSIDLIGARYVDDCHYFFQSKEDAEKALSIYSAVLGKFHLRLNTNKTQIIERPCAFEDDWLLAIKSFVFRDCGDYLIQKEDILSYTSLLIALSIKFPKASVIKKGFGRFRGIKLFNENAELFESLLYRLVLCAPVVLNQLDSYITFLEKSGHHIGRAKFIEFLDAILIRSIKNEFHYETNWALYLLKKFQLPLKGGFAQQIVDRKDVYATIQVLDMISNGLIDDMIDLSVLESDLDNSSLDSSAWLIAYEAEMNSWLQLQNIDNHPFFSALKRFNVRFYKPTKNSNESFAKTKAGRAKTIKLGTLKNVLVEEY